MNMEGQGVLVTGGASGMGRAVAALLKAKGAQVAIIDANEALLKEQVASMDVIGILADVSQADSVDKAFDVLGAQLPHLRVCVNCAGIAPAKRILGKQGPLPLEDFKKVIDVNLVGTFNVMRKAAEHFARQDPVNESGERGVIINTASVAAFEGQIGQAAYAASKGGIVSLTLPAARELARFGIRVMTIAPGLVATPLLLNMPQEVQDSLAAQVPFPQRLAKPSEFAALVLHIIENEMLNGEVIRFDGALRMQA